MIRKQFLLIFSVIVLFLSLFLLADASSNDLANKLSGRILLQVESHGEAWYVNPETKERNYLGRPDDAFNVMRQEGIGAKNSDLNKIPVDLDNLSGEDSDSDGLPDNLEVALGTNSNNADSDGDSFSDYVELQNSYNPLGINKLSFDNSFSRAQAGRILLQVERNGEAWYVNPENNKRYFLGRPSDAYNLMRRLGLGISNENLDKVKMKEESQDGSVLSPAEAGDLAQEYVNANLMSAGETATVTNITEKYGLYEMAVDVGSDVMTSYITKDGKLFFASAFNLEELLQDRVFTNEELTLEEAKELSQEFINSYLSISDTQHYIMGIANYNSVLYVLEVKSDNTFKSYITKDGKMFFPQAFEVEDETGENGDNSLTEQSVNFDDFEDKLLNCEVGTETVYSQDNEVNLSGLIVASKTDSQVYIEEKIDDECNIVVDTNVFDVTIRNLDEYVNETIEDIKDLLVDETELSIDYINNLFNTQIINISEEDKIMLLEIGFDDVLFVEENNLKILLDVIKEEGEKNLEDMLKSEQEFQQSKSVCTGQPESLLEYLIGNAGTASCILESNSANCTYENGVECSSPATE